MRFKLVAGSRIGDETLDCVDGDRLIEPSAIADRFAGALANTAAYAGKRVFDERGFPCLLEKPL